MIEYVDRWLPYHPRDTRNGISRVPTASHGGKPSKHLQNVDHDKFIGEEL